MEAVIDENRGLTTSTHFPKGPIESEFTCPCKSKGLLVPLYISAEENAVPTNR